jgi:dTDP-4-dehydrorhamnose reductase
VDDPLQLWGGIECTINRVGDLYHDQLALVGHDARVDDIDRIARLGITTLRYPVLWERVAPEGLHRAAWGRTDAHMARIRELGLEPIVGLVHHGSGPRSTSLVDPHFPDALAAYARGVAERYPWVTRYTPINEPLTTARFSTLYGHWYPHARDDRLFARAIVNEIRAIVAAMRAIREIVPHASLIQTEDLGKTHATPALQYQAEFENERRWLTTDLLCGRLAPTDVMWRFLAGAGIEERELEAFADVRCAPEIIGINHYLTSERFLDERLDRYPSSTHGGNGRDQYADVEAVRACEEGIVGVGGLLREAWARYGRALAITEAHLGSTREQQLRWMEEVWTTSASLRASGIDVRAVTAWSLFGVHDWHNLSTRREGHYESGAFDIRAPEPRATALASMASALARTGAYAHPVLRGRGWWRCHGRLTYADPSERIADAHDDDAPPILIFGARGTLGTAFSRVCRERGLAARSYARCDADISDALRIAAVLDETQPWAVVNAAGYVRVDDAERNWDACWRGNAIGVGVLAVACASRGIRLLTFSSDLVFDGGIGRTAPYLESDRPRPLNAYGRAKAQAEQLARERWAGALVVRTSAFFGPWDEFNFVAHVLRSLDAGVPVAAACDLQISPTYVPDLVHAALDLLIDGESGIWHLANEGSVSWFELAQRVAQLAGHDVDRVVACSSDTLGLVARRPRYSVLGSERGALMAPLHAALDRYFAARAALNRLSEAVSS